MKHSCSSDINNKFVIGISLNSVFIAAEVFWGLDSNSLALITDAVHNAGDVFGLLIAWFGYWLARKKAPKKFTYGYKNVTIIAAFINAMLLFISVGGIIFEAAVRFGSTESVTSTTIITVASIGVFINGLTAYFFLHESSYDINIKGAFLHMLFDAVISFGVIIAGLLILWKSWFWIDTLTSFLIAFAIIFSSWGLLKESINLMLLATPASIDQDALKTTILCYKKGLRDIHDLHIWPISTTETALSMHIVVEPEFFTEHFVKNIEKEVKTKFPISHVTIQMESEGIKDACQTNCYDENI